MTYNSNSLVTHLLNLPIAGLFALIDENNKRVYLVHSSNIRGALNRIIDDLHYKINLPQELIENRFNLKLEVLEEQFDRRTRLGRYSYYVDKYRNNGYTILREDYIPLQYKLDIQIRDYHDLVGRNNKRVFVELVSKGRQRIVVGIFRTMKEANKFIKETYGDSKYLTPVYANNRATREYYKFNKSTNG